MIENGDVLIGNHMNQGFKISFTTLTSNKMKYYSCSLYVTFLVHVIIKYLSICRTVGDYRVKLQVWDTAGQERFRSMVTTT